MRRAAFLGITATGFFVGRIALLDPLSGSSLGRFGFAGLCPSVRLLSRPCQR